MFPSLNLLDKIPHILIVVLPAVTSRLAVQISVFRGLPFAQLSCATLRHTFFRLQIKNNSRHPPRRSATRMMQDRSQLLSLAREFNNIGASFQDRGYDEDAEAMYQQALQAMSLIADNTVEVSQKNKQRLSDQIAKGKSQLACLLSSSNGNDKVAIEEQLDDIHPYQTQMLSDAMIIMDTNNDVTIDSETRDKMESAIILYNYGVMYCKNGYGPEAMKLFKMSQELSFAHVGNDNLMPIACMASLNNIGHLHFSNGCIDEGLKALTEAEELALTCFRSVLNEHETASRKIDDKEVASRCQGTYVPVVLKYVATILYNKGHAHFFKGEHEEAFGSFNQAMKFSRTAPLLHGIAIALNHLGREHEDMGLNQKALHIYRSALTTRKALIKAIDCASLPNVYYKILRNMGNLLFHEGDHNKALNALKISLALQYQSYDSLHPEIASTIHAIGAIQLKIGSFADALKSSMKAVAIRRTVFGNENLHVAESLSLLGRIFFESKHYEKTFQVYLEVFHIEESVLGSNHADVGETLCCLGLVSRRRGDLESALCMYSKALSNMQQSLGLHHPAIIAQVVHEIGNIHWERGDYNEAVNAYQESSLLLRNSQQTGNAAEVAILESYLDNDTLTCGAAAA